MTAPPRWIALPLAAVLLVCGVIGVQLANGGGTYEPLRPADPCAERTATSRADGIDGLTERLVLLGVNDAACRLGVTREALTLELAQSGARTDAEIDALRAGLLSAVRQMKKDGSLPPASDLVDEALDSANLNGLLERAIRLVPDSVINRALRTDDVLERAIEDLDLRALLANLDDQDDLERQVEAAVTEAVKESLLARLRNLL
ncbi:hypothetical protein [Aeromicrobium chenweiae]|uniref:Uncharacterized protein n=1 Tax=Aeromicrobium chenweiae TaxID=2079793 RepID=A0A2S0WNY7_9ACTN|nr:hypothetical protein [Aeromicrobium chenweiae]AWB93059.1 hypothetical protein C3E78_13055 [Aeromicrobium chenweiae]TGN34048.1 hypothetical protein E4L97_03090 [Aeromicrobium chenweiae]